ncbi:triphosphoribosyl-dephospho-CoA synthase [Streptosporangium sp. NPDC002721]|uniref:triphosphoribosyl-dephospho-CoA synthase n=1 Tax=Streptosporangium sp. NPDC002721 TaxID=3366188 RepID=UPI0036A2DE36
MTAIGDVPATGRTGERGPSPALLADLAVRALRQEACLSPKPGLADRRGRGAHDDMDLPILLASAQALRPTFHAVAEAAKRTAAGNGLRQEPGRHDRASIELRQEPGRHDRASIVLREELGRHDRAGIVLREELGRLGRAGEAAMLRATRGVNTHRGALWALGLLVATVAAGAADEREAAGRAALLAALPDRHLPPGTPSHGELARRRYGVRGARGEAEAAFPHVVEVALPRLRRAGAAGIPEEVARLDALLAVMSLLEDTCVLHRGGPEGLGVVRSGAGRVLAEGGAGTAGGRAALAELDGRCAARRLSPGGSADLLAAALFLDMVPWPGSGPGSGSVTRAGRKVLTCRR